MTRMGTTVIALTGVVGIVLIALAAVGCSPIDSAETHGSLLVEGTDTEGGGDSIDSSSIDSGVTALATFAGGCFWCMETPFEKIDGVRSVVSGYTGGHVKNPTYNGVCSGRTGHTEAIQIDYDPTRVSYEGLLQVLWRQINPTDGAGQFVDRGSQYRPGIFYHDDDQKVAAEKSRSALQASGRFSKPIVTEVTALERFYRAEEYHQDFYKKDPQRYKSYRLGSGRDRYLAGVWGKDLKFIPAKPKKHEAAARRSRRYSKPPEAEIRKRLTRLQYDVTQNDATDRPFSNDYWDNKKAGIYVDVVSGEPLFSSADKFESGTGWPSFVRPLEKANINSKTDHKLRYPRTEVRSKHGDSHLGHVFNDGPEPTGLRYCINSAALRFVPKETLEKEGYGEYLATFSK